LKGSRLVWGGLLRYVGTVVHRYRVCVADDCVETATVLCEGLALHNYDSIAAYSGEEALQVCQEGDVDLILLDVYLPGIDGYEVCKRLKQSTKTRNVVVVFVTVKGAQEDISRGFALGAADYITKPFNLPMVMVRVDAAMRRREGAPTIDTDLENSPETIYTDPLTGLRSGQYLLQRLQEEVEKAHRYDFPVSCVVFDVDDVRPLDADLGPVSLDDLLAEVAMTVRKYSRAFDVVGRYDGTLFAAILPHTPLADATKYAQKIMYEIDATTFSDPNFPTEASLSVGIAACQNGSAHGADYVLGEAMRGLFQAKSLPGDRLVARSLSAG